VVAGDPVSIPKLDGERYPIEVWPKRIKFGQLARSSGGKPARVEEGAHPVCWPRGAVPVRATDEPVTNSSVSGESWIAPLRWGSLARRSGGKNLASMRWRERTFGSFTSKRKIGPASRRTNARPCGRSVSRKTSN
jgi:hypothetical protein